MAEDMFPFFQKFWRGHIEAPSVLATELDRVWTEVQNEHPGICLSQETFITALAERVPEDGNPCSAIPKLAVADLYLCTAVLDGDAMAYVAFDYILRAAAEQTGRRFKAGPDVVDELGQKLFEHLLVPTGKKRARLHEYAAKGPLARWLQAVATRTRLNEMRGVKREVLIDDGAIFDALLQPSGPPPTVEPSKEAYRIALKSAFAQALEELSDQDKSLLRMAYLERVNLDGLGRAFGVSRATAHRRLADARDRLAKGIEVCLGAELSHKGVISPQQLASIRRLVQSQISVSLGRILQ